MHRMPSKTGLTQHGVIAAVVAVLVGTGSAVAANSETSENTQPSNAAGRPSAADSLSHKDAAKQRLTAGNSDSNAMRALTKANMAEIQLSGLAQSISENPIVRDFAQNMLNEHGNSMNELRKLAAEKKVILPGGPDEEHVTVLRQLSLLKGVEFDQKYLAHAGIEAHQTSLRFLEDTGKRVEDMDLKAHMEKQLPVIKKHLKLAQDAQRKYAAASVQKK